MTVERRLLTLLLTLLLCCTATAQVDTGTHAAPHSRPRTSVLSGTSKYPTDYFRHPIDLPVSLAGDFAEIRPNHFHSGLDLRTGGKEGERVHAPADGYVSRINISAWGGGKVLYITHPNGYRTVYMHLSAFCGDIGKLVHDYQYEHHTFTMDIELPPDSLPVRQGQLVALSGNTGGSAGPHLHYEIRHADNDQPINPLYFGIPYSDPVPPTIAGIKLYPAGQHATINGRAGELKVYPRTTGGKGKPKSPTLPDTILVCGRFYAGIYAFDRMEPGSHNKNGVEKIELYVDGELFYRYHVPTFLFEETRAINAIIDYPQYQRNREYYVVSRHLRGDRNNYSTAYRDNGYMQFDDGRVHRLEYRVSDYKGNVARQTVFVRGAAAPPTTGDNSEAAINANGEPVIYYRPFTLVRNDFSISMPAHTLYENDELIYNCGTDAGRLSPQHRVSLKRHPLPPHQSISVRLAMPTSLPETLRGRLMVVCVNGKNINALPTTREGNELCATSRTFGAFAVRLDTVPPTVRPNNFSEGRRLTADHFSVKIGDNLSGVVSYECLVNGRWELAEHDGKTASLNVNAATLQKGHNRVTFRLTDAVGNTTEQTWTITR